MKSTNRPFLQTNIAVLSLVYYQLLVSSFLAEPTTLLPLFLVFGYSAKLYPLRMEKDFLRRLLAGSQRLSRPKFNIAAS